VAVTPPDKGTRCDDPEVVRGEIAMTQHGGSQPSAYIDVPDSVFASATFSSARNRRLAPLDGADASAHSPAVRTAPTHYRIDREEGPKDGLPLPPSTPRTTA